LSLFIRKLRVLDFSKSVVWNWKRSDNVNVIVLTEVSLAHISIRTILLYIGNICRPRDRISKTLNKRICFDSKTHVVIFDKVYRNNKWQWEEVWLE
jgi:hypothetical protein